jgi:hypothetical protein
VNVTVMVPPTLKGAVDGRGRLDLGVPSSADLGDLVESLLKLYPKLALHMASEKRPMRPTLGLFVSEQMLQQFAVSRFGLKEGQKLYLSSAPLRREA